MKRYAVIVAVTLLGGCQSYVDAESELSAYVTCNHRNSIRFASQAGDPLSLAIAAEAACPGEEVALLKKLNEAKGPGGALRMMDQIRESAIRSNVATIARTRS